MVKKDGDKLTFKSALFGEITIPWDQVQELKTDNPVTVVSATGARVSTVLNAEQPALQDIKAVRDPAEQREYERRLHPSFLELWSWYGHDRLRGRTGQRENAYVDGEPCCSPELPDGQNKYLFKCYKVIRPRSMVCSQVRLRRSGVAGRMTITCHVVCSLTDSTITSMMRSKISICDSLPAVARALLPGNASMEGSICSPVLPIIIRHFRRRLLPLLREHRRGLRRRSTDISADGYNRTRAVLPILPQSERIGIVQNQFRYVGQYALTNGSPGTSLSAIASSANPSRAAKRMISCGHSVLG